MEHAGAILWWQLELACLGQIGVKEVKQPEQSMHRPLMC